MGKCKYCSFDKDGYTADDHEDLIRQLVATTGHGDQFWFSAGIYSDTFSWTILDPGSGNELCGGYQEIRFCPMCGRILDGGK